MKFLFWSTFVISVWCSQIGKDISLAVTIYNDNFAMVKDVRQITFDQGQSSLYFTDVSSNIQTETVTFKALGNPESVRVYEQNFDKNLINTNSLLDKYIEKEIEITAQLGNGVRSVKGKLLGYDQGYILQTNKGANIYNQIADIRFPTLPDGFFTTPTLSWKVWSQHAMSSRCEVAYRTTGFSWKADYSITLNEQENRADLGGWVTIDNRSGKKYTNTKLKLIAGDVNTVRNSNSLLRGGQGTVKRSSKKSLGFEEKSFADYHLYTLSAPVNLNQSSQKQVEFIPKVFDLPIHKYHEIKISSGGNAQENLKAKNYLQFKNEKRHGLGIPFPKGIIRVFKEDQDDGSLEFIGEDKINHTPKNQKITITTGKAFDIVAEKYSLSKKSLDNRGSYRASMKMVIKNHKEIDAETVVVFSNSYGKNLKINEEESNDVQLVKESNRVFKWKKIMKANEKWVIKWTETYRRP